MRKEPKGQFLQSQYLPWTQKVHSTIQTSRGPQPTVASYELYMTHRVFYSTSMTVTNPNNRYDVVMFVDFNDKTRVGKRSDMVAHRGDQSGPVVAVGKFHGKQRIEFSWNNGSSKAQQTTSLSREGSPSKTQNSHRVHTSRGRRSAPFGPDLFWRVTWDYEARKLSFGNFELVDANGRAYAVLSTVVHKSWSKIGTLHLFRDMDPEMLDIVMVTMVAMVKKIEKEGWNTKGTGGGMGCLLVESAADNAASNVASSIIGAMFGG